MRKKPRKIVVDSVEYQWAAVNFNGDGDGGIGLKVWKDKKLVLEQWLNELNIPDNITPKFVAERIKTDIKQKSL